MAPLDKDIVQVRSKTKGLLVGDFVVRHTEKNIHEIEGWKFQALLHNKTSWDFESIECDLRYFSADGTFLGVDHAFLFLRSRLARTEDKAISIFLSVPQDTAKAVFTAKAEYANSLETHSIVIIAAAIVLAAVLYFLK